MPVRIEPEPTDAEREAILAALTPERDESEWAAAALAEGVEDAEAEP